MFSLCYKNRVSNSIIHALLKFCLEDIFQCNYFLATMDKNKNKLMQLPKNPKCKTDSSDSSVLLCWIWCLILQKYLSKATLCRSCIVRIQEQSKYVQPIPWNKSDFLRVAPEPSLVLAKSFGGIFTICKCKWHTMTFMSSASQWCDL